MINLRSFVETDPVKPTDRFAIEYVRGLDIRVDSEHVIHRPYAVFLWRGRPTQFVADFRSGIEAYAYAESLARHYNLKNDLVLVSDGVSEVLNIEIKKLDTTAR